uniref:AWS domain-containing protein n=1 Tax=Macrostomum lignano TaxID=282301 RepID=A0A1I8FIR4_9PLAT
MRTPPVRGAVPPGPLPALPPHPAQPSVLPVRCSGHPASRALRCPAARLRLPVSAAAALRPPSLHECHLAGEPCPPCAYLISKRCQCGRSLRQNLRHPVRRSLPCGHRCALLCHSGDCEGRRREAAAAGLQAAAVPAGPSGLRPPLHAALPPSGAMQAAAPCQSEPSRYAVPALAESRRCRATSPQMGNAGLHLTVALGGEMDLQAYRELQTRGSLQCDAQCQLEKRNRQLAEALGVETDSNGSTAAAAGGGAVNLAPVYARTLLDLWKAYPSFAVMVESRLDETCSAVVSGRSQSRQHQFQAPNRDGQKVLSTSCRGVRLRGSGDGRAGFGRQPDGDGHGEARPGPPAGPEAVGRAAAPIRHRRPSAAVGQHRLLPRAVQSWSSGLAVTASSSQLTLWAGWPPPTPPARPDGLHGVGRQRRRLPAAQQLGLIIFDFTES